MKRKSYFFGLLLSSLMFISPSVLATGWSNAAVPTRIDVVQGRGFMIFGDFGPGATANCTVTDRIFIQMTHPQYNQLYSTALAAFMAGKKVFAYAHACTSIGWYSLDTVTYNTVTPDGGLVVTN